MDWLDLLALPGTLKSLQHHSSKASTPLYLIQRGMFSLRPTQSLEVSSFLCPAPSFCNVYLRTWWGGRHPQTLPPGPQPGRSGHGTWGHSSWPWGGTCPPSHAGVLLNQGSPVAPSASALNPGDPESNRIPPTAATQVCSPRKSCAETLTGTDVPLSSDKSCQRPPGIILHKQKPSPQMKAQSSLQLCFPL